MASQSPDYKAQQQDRPTVILYRTPVPMKRARLLHAMRDNRQPPMKITSSHNPRFQQAGRLRDARGRQRQGRMIIDGVREIGRALDAGVRVVEAFVYPPWYSPPGAELVQRLESAGVALLELTRPLFEKLAFGQRGEGVVAVADTPEVGLDGLSLPPEGLVAVLEGVEKPGNVGAVIRSAAAAGLAAVIAADSGTDLYNPNTIRASLGAIFTVPVAAAPAAQVLGWLRDLGFSIFAARVDAPLCYTDVSYRGRSAVVLGSEARGLTDAWQSPAVTPIRLPMRGVVDSLNVSVAAGVIFFEALRQREACYITR